MRASIRGTCFVLAILAASVADGWGVLADEPLVPDYEPIQRLLPPEGIELPADVQNPKLPDWAIIDLSQPPDASAPGKIHAAGFFDERWQLPAGK